MELSSPNPKNVTYFFPKKYFSYIFWNGTF